MLRIATRGSALARWQAEHVATSLCAAWPGLQTSLVIVETTGDQRLDVPVWEIGGQGVFVTEVEAALREGRADVAVHSAKDLPSTLPDGLVLAAVAGRVDPRDALVGRRFDDLASGATVATGAVRRRAQLAWLRPDLTFASLRGNVPTRLGKVPAGGAVVVAFAALARLGLAASAAEVLDTGRMLPQVGQGAIAVEARADDHPVLERLRPVDDRDAHDAVRAERAFLGRLGGGCDLPVGAYARLDHDEITLEGLVASPDGRIVLRERRRAGRAEAEELGRSVASHLLDDAGGAQVLGLPGSRS